jgi:hypothetical protein
MAPTYWDAETEEVFKKLYVDAYEGVPLSGFNGVKPGLRFGWDKALASEYPNETWEEVEDDLERTWKEMHTHHGSWQDMKEHVHRAWKMAKKDWENLASHNKGK